MYLSIRKTFFLQKTSILLTTWKHYRMVSMIHFEAPKQQDSLWHAQCWSTLSLLNYMPSLIIEELVGLKREQQRYHASLAWSLENLCCPSKQWISERFCILVRWLILIRGVEVIHQKLIITEERNVFHMKCCRRFGKYILLSEIYWGKYTTQELPCKYSTS